MDKGRDWPWIGAETLLPVAQEGRRRTQCRYRKVCRSLLGRRVAQSDSLKVTPIQCSCFMKFDVHIT